MNLTYNEITKIMAPKTITRPIKNPGWLLSTNTSFTCPILLRAIPPIAIKAIPPS